jgi:3-oxoacyl-[acyl-carrier protein] reductase
VTYSSASSSDAVEALVQRLNAEALEAEDPPLKEASRYLHAIGIQADLRDPSAAAEIVSKTIEAFGESINILVNNAGVNKVTPLRTVTVDDFSDMFDTNVRAAVLLTQATLPYMMTSESGRIINIGSTAGRVGVPGGYSLYCASKLAIEGLSRAWAAELGDQNITVNTVAPGSTQSTLLTNSAQQADIDEEAARTPAGRRVGQPEDIARVVAWLCSEDSAWITGQCICASGGYRMY